MAVFAHPAITTENARPDFLTEERLVVGHFGLFRSSLKQFLQVTSETARVRLLGVVLLA